MSRAPQALQAIPDNRPSLPLHDKSGSAAKTTPLRLYFFPAPLREPFRGLRDFRS